MKFVLLLALLFMLSDSAASNDRVPPHPESPDDPRPIITIPTVDPLKRVPWTRAGGGFLIDAIRQMCVGDNGGKTRCEPVEKDKYDRGQRIFDAQTGSLLFVMDRAIAEEVQQDSAISAARAEEHHPYSMYIARMEARKSNWEYLGVACSTAFGPYCGAMAAKLSKYKELAIAGCTAALGACQKMVKDEQTEIQKEIDRVLAACQTSDQACFDAITGGGETQARAQSALEKSSGERPPHNPTGPWAPGRPVAAGMPGEWYDGSCEHCTVTDGDD